uniref:VWFA domain-containing protein n=1 Tax=Meloidogyne incognita TaxID=6306 RepID=A0A914LZM3_MELIC
MVRKAIEDISYRGGSTLTSKAVELAVQDLEKGRRDDALQVIVLMNDGMSQDPWENVLAASKRLAQSGAERFGVALGEEVDLRELEHYVGDKKRIYRDGSTERFLEDIVGLINNNNKCFDNNSEKKIENLNKNDKNNNEGVGGGNDGSGPREFGDFQRDDSNTCQKAKLDLIVVLDNTDISSTGNDPKLSSNRYLLLDVLGSLPLSHRVRLAVISIGEQHQELYFSEVQDRESIFKKIERIRPISIRPNYSKAVETAINYYNGAGRRPESNGLILIVGDGKNDLEGPEERKRVGELIKRTPGLSCHAVDSSKEVDEQTLSAFTGSVERIYPYDRNAEFAHFLLAKALECQPSESQLNSSSNFFVAGSEEQIEKSKDDEEMEEEPFERRETKNNSSKRILIEGKKIIEEVDDKEEKNQRQKDIVAVLPLKKEEEENFNLNLENKIVLPNKQKLNENNLKNIERVVLSRINTTKNIIFTSTPPTLINLSTTKLSTIALQKTTTNKQNVGRINENNFRNNVFSQRGRNELNTAFTTSTKRPTGTSINSFRTSRKQQTILEPKTIQIISSQRTRPPLPSIISSSTPTQSTTLSTFSSPTTTFRPGCLIDLILLIDSSGSVEQAFEQEKRLAADIIRKLRLGPKNAHVALIKFAAADKVRTIQSFLSPQSQERLLYLLNDIPFSDGITAIHSALRQAIAEYTIERGARPGVAIPIAVVITDGFGQHDFSIESLELHKLIPNIFAVAVNNNETMAVARDELARISGDPNKVFTDKSIGEFHKILGEQLRGC